MSPKLLSLFGLSSLLHAKAHFAIPNSPNRDVNSLVSYVGLSHLMDSGVPTYFLGRDMGQALMATELPRDLRFSDIKWAHDAMLFVLPQPSTYAFVLVCRRPAEGQCNLAGFGPSRSWYPEPGAVHAEWMGIVCYDSVGEVIYSWQHPICDLLAGESYDKLKHTEGWGIQDRDMSVNKDDHDFIRLALSLLLLMQARPDQVQGEEHPADRPSRVARGRCSLWHPRWVGKNYVIARSHQGGTHASPRMHPRAGHWRHYNSEKGWRETRMVWIEPTMVMA